MPETKKKNNQSRSTYILDNCSLYKENDDGSSAKLSWAIRGDYPRIIVIPGDVKETSGDHQISIIAPMTVSVLYGLLNTLLDTSRPISKGNGFKMDCYNLKWVNNKRTDEKYIREVITVDYDDELGVWLSVTAPDRKVVRFSVSNTLWHTISDRGAQSESAEILANGYFSMVLEEYKKVILPKKTEILLGS